jgi:hypothetical protein
MDQAGGTQKDIVAERMEIEIDGFEINMFHLQELIANRNKGCVIFLGKYCFVDNDYFLD